MCRELDEKGGDQVTPMLFVDVPKIEVEICHRGLACITHGFDILNDCGTGKRQANQLSLMKISKLSTNQSILLPEPASNKGSLTSLLVGAERRNRTGAHVFHEPTVATRNLLTSIPCTYFLRKTRSPFPCDERGMQCCDS